MIRLTVALNKSGSNIEQFIAKSQHDCLVLLRGFLERKLEVKELYISPEIRQEPILLFARDGKHSGWRYKLRNKEWITGDYEVVCEQFLEYVRQYGEWKFIG